MSKTEFFKKSIDKKTADNPNWYFYALSIAVFLEYIRPQNIFTFLEPLRIPALVITAMFFIFITNQKSYLLRDRGYLLIIVFWLLVSVSVLYTTNTRQTYENSMVMLWMMLGFIFPMAVIVDSVKKVIQLWWVWLAAHFILGCYILLNGGVGPGGILADENDVALALVMAVPYFYFMIFSPIDKKIVKILLILALLLIIGAIAVTSSRGGIVGLAAVMFIIMMMSRKPIRNFLIAIVGTLLLGGIVIASLPPEYVQDMVNMSNPEDSTRDERIYTWSIGWAMFLEHPIMGVGSGDFPWVNYLYHHLSPLWEPGRKYMGGRVAHSVYFTIIPEMGLMGIIVFVSLIKVIYNRYRNAKRALKNAVETKELIMIRQFNNAMIVALVGFLVSGAFISVLFYPFFWHLLSLIMVTFHATNNQFLDKDNQPINFLSNIHKNIKI